MLELSQFKQLTNLSDLKSHRVTKFVMLPENLKHRISYKALLSEATFSDLGDKVNVVHFLKDKTCYFSYVDEFDLLDSREIHDVLMVDYNEDDREEFIATFENRAALETYLEDRLNFPSNAVYLELDDQILQEIEDRTRKDQIEFCDKTIARAKREMKIAAATVKEYEDLKGELMND